jgi:MbtH protein
VTNPFDDENGTYMVLVNHEGQHSLWPSFVEVPPGWTVAHGEDTRQSCIDHINANWLDIRPRSVMTAPEPPQERSRP